MSRNRLEVVLADSEESRKIHFNLRYKIYCLEKGFLEAKNPEEEMEQDAFDEKSVHFLIKSGDEWVGTFRLVVDRKANLPYHKVSPHDSTNSFNDLSYSAEFSRLGILRTYQKLHNNQAEAEASNNEPEIMLKLLHAARDYCMENDIQNMFFLCRRSIARVLQQFKLHVQQIGPAIFHHGPRVPYAIKVMGRHDDFHLLVDERVGSKKSYSLFSELVENQHLQVQPS